MWQRVSIAVTIFAIASIAREATADTNVYGRATLGTDFVFRGVSQTLSSPALQLELIGEHSSGWWASLWLSNVDYSPPDLPDDGASYEIDVSAGLSLDLSERLAGTVAAVRYMFPDTVSGYDYDYFEWLGSLEIDDRHTAVLGYSGNVFGSGSPGTFLSLATRTAISDQVSLTAELGYYDLRSAYESAYGYAELAVETDAMGAEWKLSYFSVTDVDEEIFYGSTVADRVVLTVSISF